MGTRGGSNNDWRARRWRDDWIAVIFVAFAYENGLPFSVIAPIFGVSRSAIGGVVFRYVNTSPLPRKRPRRLRIGPLHRTDAWEVRRARQGYEP